MTESSTSNNLKIKFAGFIVGIDTKAKKLSIRPSNMVLDETGTNYGIGIVDSEKKDAVLIDFVVKNNKRQDFITFKYVSKKACLENLCCALLHRGKVWLTLKVDRGRSLSTEDRYTVVDLLWKA